MELTHLSLPPLTAPGEVVTFYSYKGGTGRTMALSNLALLLARRQNATVPILMIDWDLEAPGLHHYFDVRDEGPGVLELFEACREQLRRRRGGAVGLDDVELAQLVLGGIDWEKYITRVDQASPLYLMRAGHFDDSYGDRLAGMDWEELFDQCPALFRCFADNLARHFRYVLVDSRTGRTDSAGICTTLLPKKLVVVFTPNRQSVEGVQSLVMRATTYRRSHEDEQRPLLVYPLPSRIEMGDGEQRAQWRRGDARKDIVGYQPLFEQLLRDCYGKAQLSLDSYFDEVQLQQTKTFAYGEQLAARIDQGGDRFSLTRTFEAFLDWLGGGYFPWQSSREIHLLSSIGEARHALAEGNGRAVALPLARDLSQLGELHRRENRPLQALQCFEESMTLRQRTLGEDHVDTLSSKSSLALVLRQQGRLEEAQFLEECVLDTQQRLQGDEHPDTLAARANLAETLSLQGAGTEALLLQGRVLDAYLRLLGPEHLLTLSAQASRAEMLCRRGEWVAARQLQEHVVRERKQLLGAEHPDTLRSKAALAHTLQQLHEFDAARDLYELLLRAQTRRLGPDHADTLALRAQLDEVLHALGETPLLAVHQDVAASAYGGPVRHAMRAVGATRHRPGVLPARRDGAEENA